MNGHRSAIKKGDQSLFHRHFHQPNHSVDDMRVQILEKIYHSSGSPSLSAPPRRERVLFWIKELGTAKPYDFNDQIKGIGTLTLFWTGGGGGKFAPPAGFLNIAQKPLSLGS